MNTPELEIANPEVDIENMEKVEELALWTYYSSRFTELSQSAELILSGDPEKSGKLARVARLDLKKLRVEIENKRVELGEYHLRKTKAINSEAKKLKEFIEPFEQKLLEVENFAEIKEADRKQKLSQERTEKIVSVEGNIAGINFGEMSEEQFGDMLAGAVLVFEAKKEASKKAEEARIAKEEADKKEQERIRLENEELKRVAAEKEAALEVERKKVEAERKRVEEAQAAELAKVQAKAKEEKDAADAVALKEKLAKEKLEQEIAEKNRLEQEKLVQQAEARKRAESAPDRDKIIAFSETVKALQGPTLTTPKGKEVAAEIASKILAFSVWITKKTAELE